MSLEPSAQLLTQVLKWLGVGSASAQQRGERRWSRTDLACSGAVYQDAERPGPLDQSMVRPQLPQQDR